MKEANIRKGMEIALELARFTANIHDIVEILAVLLRVFCWRTHEDYRRIEKGERLNDIQEKVFTAARQ